MRTLLLAAVLAVLAAAQAPAARHDAEKLPVTRIRDLHYGDALFYFYQDEEFEALTRLLAYEHWNRVPHHLDEARSEEHTSELQSLTNLVCRLLLEKKKQKKTNEN